MKRNSVGLFIGLLMIGGLILGNVTIVSAYNSGKTEVTHIEKVYQGRVFFTDESEYNIFKNTLATRNDVVILKLDVLSSDKPLVMFSVRVDGEASFPYGTLIVERIHYAWDVQSLIFTLAFVNLLGGCVVCAFFYFYLLFLN